jgi:hypothetical protein
MAITIQVLSTSIETKPTTKGSYQQLEVAYKNLSFQGKVEAKKLMSFGANEGAFKVLSTATAASVWDIEIVKNDKGYNDWVKVTKGSVNVTAPGGTVNTTSSPASATTKGGWETPEERAKKQIYIVRQSSISAAVNALSVGVKTGPKANEVIEYARELEAFIFSSAASEATARQDVGSIETLDEDIPY